MRQKTTVILREMAEVLTYELGLDPPLSQYTPYDWWKRTKAETISMPMPKPIRFVGRTPVFLLADIKRWYRAYSDGKRQ